MNTKYGRWEVLKVLEERAKNGKIKILCKCECGTIRDVIFDNVKRGKSRSCGCLERELTSKRSFKHGYSKTGKLHPLYKVWSGVKERCVNKNHKSYKYYGGRGIELCKEWLDNPKSFIEWGLSNGYKKGLEIDRIDNDKSYSPINCRFITHQRNCINQRISKKNKSGYNGVLWNKQNSKWVARVNNNKRIHLGYFNTKKEALEKRNNYIIKNNLPHKIQEWKTI